jgi:hypothetical protein
LEPELLLPEDPDLPTELLLGLDDLLCNDLLYDLDSPLLIPELDLEIVLPEAEEIDFRELTGFEPE